MPYPQLLYLPALYPAAQPTRPASDPAALPAAHGRSKLQ
jgi:hypothetical protein